MSDVIELDLLQPGDVVLCQSNAIMGRLIQLFDGSSFSHAALYMGNGKLGEATSHGVETVNLAEKVEIYAQVQAKRLIDAPATMDPVVRAAGAYLDKGERYGYEQMVLFAFLAITRKVKINPTLRAIIRRVLDSAASLLLAFTHSNRQPMICSELVYRAYDEAVPGAENPYSLSIAPLSPGPAARASLSASSAAAASPQSLGQGVHPHSLLAFMASDVSNVWLPRPPAPEISKRELSVASAAPSIDEAELEELFERYLEEVRMPPARAAAASAVSAASAAEDTSLTELRGAVENFAASFAQAADAQAAGAQATAGHAAPAEIRSLSASRSPLERLFKTAADFVSPADLDKCQSLFPLGKLAT